MPDNTQRLLLLDLDGTISNPLTGICRSINHALTWAGHPPLPEAEIKACVGPPIADTFRAILPTASSAEMAELLARYRERYADAGYAENVLYPGMFDTLNALHDRGIALAVCTSKRQDFATRIIEMFGLRHGFRFICGAVDGEQKWQQIAALKAANLVHETSLMVGDRGLDISAAHRNGLEAAGVLWGFGSRQELEREKPEYLLQHVAELGTLVMPARSDMLRP